MFDRPGLFLLFSSGGSLIWLALYAAGLILAVRARRERAPGAGLAAAGFGLTTAGTAATGAVTVWQGVALTYLGPTAFASTYAVTILVSLSANLTGLVGHGVLLAAFVSAWRAATDGPPPQTSPGA